MEWLSLITICGITTCKTSLFLYLLLLLLYFGVLLFPLYFLYISSPLLADHLIRKETESTDRTKETKDDKEKNGISFCFFFFFLSLTIFFFLFSSLLSLFFYLAGSNKRTADDKETDAPQHNKRSKSDQEAKSHENEKAKKDEKDVEEEHEELSHIGIFSFLSPSLPLPLSPSPFSPSPLFLHFATGDKDQIIKDFRKLINMTGDEIHKWLESKESKEVGWKGEGGHDQSMSSFYFFVYLYLFFYIYYITYKVYDANYSTCSQRIGGSCVRTTNH